MKLNSSKPSAIQIYVLTKTYLTRADTVVTVVSSDGLAIFTSADAAKDHCLAFHNIKKTAWEDVKYSNILCYKTDNSVYKIWDMVTKD